MWDGALGNGISYWPLPERALNGGRTTRPVFVGGHARHQLEVVSLMVLETDHLVVLQNGVASRLAGRRSSAS